MHLDIKKIALIVVASLVFLYICGVVVHKEPPPRAAPTFIQLPRSVYPKLYFIKLEIDDNLTRVDGSERIELSCLSDENSTFLHASKLDIRKLKIFNELNEQQNSDYYIHEDHELIEVVNHDIFIANQTYSLYIEFTVEKIPHKSKTGFHHHKHFKTIGLYTFRDNTSAINKSAITQFQPGFARKLFPSFDDPYFRSIYKVIVTHSKDFIALSNAPIKSVTTNDDSFVTTEFEESVELPTYLVALGLLPNNSKEFYMHQTRIRIWKSHNYEEFKQVVEFGINELIDIFNITIPLSELSFVMCPHMVLGMENFGLITINSEIWTGNAELYLEGFKTVLHELGHHWWSNLVSPAWWTDLWVDEGFTMYLELLLTEKFVKQFRMDLIEELKASTIRVYAQSLEYRPYQVIYGIENGTSEYLLFEGFRSIVYSKGMLLAKYFHYIVGEKFFKCWQDYIKQNFLTSQASWEFVSFLTECSSDVANRKKINQSMYDWSLNRGFPILIVSKTNDSKLIVTQRNCVSRIIYRDVTWTIKLSISRFDGLNGVDFWLENESQIIDYDQSQPFIIDYYKRTPVSVWYDRDHWGDLIDSLSKKTNILQDLAYTNLLYDYNFAIVASSAPISAIFKVLDNTNISDSSFQYLYKLYDNLFNTLSTFMYSEKQVELSQKTHRKFSEYFDFEVCDEQNLTFGEETMCRKAHTLCIVDNSTICKGENISETKDPKFNEFLEFHDITEKGSLYITNSNLVFDDLQNFSHDTIEDVLRECIEYCVCRYKLIHHYSKYSSLKNYSRRLANHFSDRFFDLHQILFRDDYPEVLSMYEVDPNYIETGFDDLSQYFSP